MQDVIEATAWIERSMPPVMMTKVAPAAIKNSVMVSAVITRRLLGLIKPGSIRLKTRSRRRRTISGI